jgi:pyridoxal 5-phosphate dependent beta-lyase
VTARPWSAWAASRPPTDLLHVDTAAFGRSSSATLEATAAHARLEAEVGGYVAEEQAAARLDALHCDLAGMLGTDAEGVALVESATAAFEALLHAWPLRAGARVGVAAAEWGPNVEKLAEHDLVVEPMPVDGSGVIDLEALERLLAGDAPDILLVDQVAAQRGLVQPAAEIVALGRAQGVAVWVDAAQAIGHVVVPPGADAVLATSRKWLTGPRGVGMLAVAGRHRPDLRVRRTAKHPDWPPVRLLESEEAHVAGRVGLGVAVQEHLAFGTDVIAGRLAEVGAAVRELGAGLDGWEVVHADAPAGATTALRPTAGQDVVAVREGLLHDQRILTTVCQPWRAPRERDTDRAPWLRLSPHVDVTDADLERVARALDEF